VSKGLDWLIRGIEALSSPPCPSSRDEITPSRHPGLGIEFLPDLDRREDAAVRVSRGG
jgi:hypothetical protein